MKKFMSLLLLLSLCLSLLCACGGTEQKETESGTETEAVSEKETESADTEEDTSQMISLDIPAKDSCTVHSVSYAVPVLETENDVKRWENENRLSNQACKRGGVVISPYFTLKINGTEVPVYAARTAHGAHSFAYVDLADVYEKGFILEAEVNTHTERSSPVVLPESSGVKAEMSTPTTATALIWEYGSYTFTFDRGEKSDGSEHPLTLMVKPKEVLEIPKGYKTVEIKPGEYPYNKLKNIMSRSKTVYIFKSGEFVIDAIKPQNDTVLYFEDGVMLVSKPLTLDSSGKPYIGTMFDCWGSQDLTIKGRAILDLSYRYEGMNGVTLSFDHANNIELAGLTVVNPCNWTICFSTVQNSSIRDCMVLGYRTYSDGIMVSDSRNITVSGCFVRTGDDGIEVKSTSDGSVRMSKVLFENNAVWTDKGIGYGAVYESNYPVKDVTWRNNSVGFALADWSEHLGCLTVSINGHSGKIAKRSDLHFENIEIYASYCPVFTLYMSEGGTAEDIHLENISAKYVSLNSQIFKRGPIDLMAVNHIGKSQNYSIGSFYFDGISINGEALTAQNAQTLITHNFPKSFSFDRELLKINSK